MPQHRKCSHHPKRSAFPPFPLPVSATEFEMPRIFSRQKSLALTPSENPGTFRTVQCCQDATTVQLPVRRVDIVWTSCGGVSGRSVMLALVAGSMAPQIEQDRCVPARFTPHACDLWIEAVRCQDVQEDVVVQGNCWNVASVIAVQRQLVAS